VPLDLGEPSRNPGVGLLARAARTAVTGQLSGELDDVGVCRRIIAAAHAATYDLVIMFPERALEQIEHRGDIRVYRDAAGRGLAAQRARPSQRRGIIVTVVAHMTRFALAKIWVELGWWERLIREERTEQILESGGIEIVLAGHVSAL
jgi:hypothetical protein